MEERVGGVGCRNLVAHPCFHGGPHASVEAIDLWHHIGQIERLIIGVA